MRSWSWSFGAASVVTICVASGVAGGSTVACSAFTSDDSEVTPDGGGADACDDGGCVSLDGCAEKVLYVSAEGGNDANTGCNRLLPKKTLGSAVATLVLLKRPDFEIHACKGEYRENGLPITFPVAILGGYECSTGKRLDDYGYPKFNTLNESVLSVADGGTMSAALTIGGFQPGVTGVVRVDGFRIRGPVRPNVTASAVALTAGATATLSNDAIEGGGSAGARTVGIELTDTGPVRIERSVVSGGSGNTVAMGIGTVGSVGVVVLKSGPVVIDESFIAGGSGTSSVDAGSVGVAVVAGDKPTKITKSVIYGGTGTGSVTASRGILTFGANLDLDGNIVLGGDGKCSAAGCTTTGIELGGGKNRIARNQIFGGNLPSSATGAVTFIGVAVNTAIGTEVTNNFILAGNATGITPTATSGAVGIRVYDGSGALIRHNTILTGKSGGTLGAVALVLSGRHAGAVIDGNLFVGLRAADETGVFSECGTIASLDSNGFFDLDTLVRGSGKTSAGCPNFAPRLKLVDLSTFADGVANNRRLSGDCAGEAGCVAPLGCNTSGAACRAEMFENFDEAKLGASSFTGERPGLLWRNKACGFANGGILIATVPTDFFGTMRTPPTSFGAHEQDTCQ